MESWGVLQFPGSCDERDALAACERTGEARLVWHEETDLSGLDGDRRARAASPTATTCGPARSRASLPRWRRSASFAADGGPVLGICNGFQVLCEAGLLPGALLANERLRFVCRQVDWSLRRPTRSSPRGSRPASPLSIPVKHMSGRYFAPDDVLDELEADGRVAFRYAPGENPNGSVRDIAGVTNEAGNVLGLMPHPEHAVDPLTGSDDGLRRCSSALAGARMTAAR